MAEPVAEIPNRPAFRAAEVCEIAQIPSYVLKSWEKEFPGLGMDTKPGGPRVYRRADVEQVMRIKQLLFTEGLTLAGARRRLEGEPRDEASAPIDFPVPDEVRARVGKVKRELRSLLDLLSAGGATSPSAASPALEPGQVAAPVEDKSAAPVEERSAVVATEDRPDGNPAEASWPPASEPDFLLQNAAGEKGKARASKRSRRASGSHEM